MSAIVADTHTLIWYITKPNYLSTEAHAALENTSNEEYPIFLSAISMVEICYLTEKGRISPIVLERIKLAMSQKDSVIEVIPLDYKIALTIQQIDRTIVPEMPDRIIAATALYLGLPLVTKDHKIRDLSVIQTIW
jgi:PIN domain nuclease of toxin-antitoxin system